LKTGSSINAVNLNFGGSKGFVVDPCEPGYALGTNGVDPSSKTAWGILNHNTDFAVADDIEVVPGKR
jgi:hypothetical protein